MILSPPETKLSRDVLKTAISLSNMSIEVHTDDYPLTISELRHHLVHFLTELLLFFFLTSHLRCVSTHNDHHNFGDKFGPHQPLTHPINFHHLVYQLTLQYKGLKINEDKTKVMFESFGTDITQVVGNVKHPCSVCLKGVGVNSIRCTQCVQWVRARYSRVKGSLKKVESSFICRRCNGELCETRQVNSQVNGLYIDGHENEIVDKFCY